MPNGFMMAPLGDYRDPWWKQLYAKIFPWTNLGYTTDDEPDVDNEVL